MRRIALSLLSLGLLAAEAGAQAQPQLTYFGRSTVRIVTASGFTVYLDPYAPGDYTRPADLILVTHGHGDHNQVGLVTKAATAVMAAPAGAIARTGVKVLTEGEIFSVGPVSVRVLPAANKNHHRGECFGYLLTFDGKTLYHAGDTDYLPEMETWRPYKIDYALLPCDGFYNMGPAEASKVAAAIGAACVLPMHSSKAGNFDEANARAVTGPRVVVLKPGEGLGL